MKKAGLAFVLLEIDQCLWFIASVSSDFLSVCSQITIYKPIFYYLQCSFCVFSFLPVLVFCATIGFTVCFLHS